MNCKVLYTQNSDRYIVTVTVTYNKGIDLTFDCFHHTSLCLALHFSEDWKASSVSMLQRMPPNLKKHTPFFLHSSMDFPMPVTILDCFLVELEWRFNIMFEQIWEIHVWCSRRYKTVLKYDPSISILNDFNPLQRIQNWQCHLPPSTNPSCSLCLNSLEWWLILTCLNRPLMSLLCPPPSGNAFILYYRTVWPSQPSALVSVVQGTPMCACTQWTWSLSKTYQLSFISRPKHMIKGCYWSFLASYACEPL